MNLELEDELGDIIGKARDGKGWSQEDLAKDSSIKLAEVSRIESCALIPDDEVIRSMAESLNLNAPALIAIAHKVWGPEPSQGDPEVDVNCIKVYMGMYPVKCYVLTCRKTGETAVVDTGGNPEEVILQTKKLRLKPSKIFLTHTHPDHAGGLDRLDREYSCPAWLDEDEPKPQGSRDLKVVKDGDVLELGALQVKVLTNPGHTPGGCSYYTGRSLICGDAIFAGSMGRANNSFPKLFNAVTHKLLVLPDETVIHPGHGPSTTVGEEKKHNPFFCGRV